MSVSRWESDSTLRELQWESPGARWLLEDLSGQRNTRMTRPQRNGILTIRPRWPLFSP